MIIALVRALTLLAEPPMRRVVALSLALAAASFAVLWLVVALALERLEPFGWRPLDWLLDLLGTLAVLGLSWLLFPAVTTLIQGIFLDRIADAVEKLDYPGLDPPRRQPWTETILSTLRLMGLTICLNLLALPLYLLVSGINVLVFLALNGYLLGREYFEVVALRRLDAATVRSVRRRFSGRVFLGGVVIAGLFALPLVNLVAPVIATAFMVHLFEGLLRSEQGRSKTEGRSS